MVSRHAVKYVVRLPPDAPQTTWCPGEDSNLHELLHWYLKPARLPVPPPGQVGRLSRGAGIYAPTRYLSILATVRRGRHGSPHRPALRPPTVAAPGGGGAFERRCDGARPRGGGRLSREAHQLCAPAHAPAPRARAPRRMLRQPAVRILRKKTRAADGDRSISRRHCRGAEKSCSGQPAHHRRAARDVVKLAFVFTRHCVIKGRLNE